MIVASRERCLTPDNPPVKEFSTSHLFTPQPADVFAWKSALDPRPYPFAVKVLYMFGQLGALAVLCFLGMRLTNTIVSKVQTVTCIVFLPLVGLWAMSFNGGIAFAKGRYDRDIASISFDVAPMLQRMAGKKHVVYIKSVRTGGRVPWVYQSFFTPDLAQKKNSKSIFFSTRKLIRSMAWARSVEDLQKIAVHSFGATNRDRWSGAFMLPYGRLDELIGDQDLDALSYDFVLTDTPNDIEGIWPQAQIVDSFEENGLVLYEMSLPTY